MTDKKHVLLRKLPLVIGGFLTLVIAFGVYFLQGMFEKPAKAKKQIQQITMIQPPPPPPSAARAKATAARARAGENTRT
jgi:hypothetical protein